MDEHERNLRRSAAMRKRWADPEQRAKLERNSINEGCPEWLRTQRSERMKARWADGAARKKLAAAMTVAASRRATPQELVAALLASPTPEIGPPKNPVKLVSKRFEHATKTDVDFSALPEAIDETPPQPKQKGTTPWRTPRVE